MPARLPIFSADRKCDLPAEPEAIRCARACSRLTWQITAPIAHELHLSQRTVESWGEPYGGHRNPIETLRHVVRTAVEHGRHQEAAEVVALLAELVPDHEVIRRIHPAGMDPA